MGVLKIHTHSLLHGLTTVTSTCPSRLVLIPMVISRQRKSQSTLSHRLLPGIWKASLLTIGTCRSKSCQSELWPTWFAVPLIWMTSQIGFSGMALNGPALMVIDRLYLKGWGLAWWAFDECLICWTNYKIRQICLITLTCPELLPGLIIPVQLYLQSCQSSE